MYKTILVAVDGSENAISAVQQASQIAGCKLIPETTFKRGYNE